MLEEKKYCYGVFLEVAQAFPKVWYKRLLIKLREQLPLTWYILLESHLTERQLRVRVMHEKAIIGKTYQPQGSVLEHIIYLLYTADIPINCNAMIGMFPDDTGILKPSSDQQTATENVQTTINHISNWTRR